MTPEDLDQRVRQIDGYIRVLTQECHILDERRHILAPLIQDAEIQAGLKAKLDKTPGANAWNHLTPLLGQDLVRDQSRLFLDKDSRSGSLPNLWRKLHADPAIKECYRDRYGTMFDHLHEDPISDLPPESSAVIQERFREQDRATNYAQFDTRLAKVEADMAALKAHPAADKIKTMRDKHHAHLEMSKLDDEPAAFDINTLGLTFNELLAFGDRCQAIVAELGLLLTGTNWDPKQFASVHEKQGKAMWRTLAGL
ncbi:AbiU2 domain-containing protein [Lysobacter sp. A289]